MVVVLVVLVVVVVVGLSDRVRLLAHSQNISVCSPPLFFSHTQTHSFSFILFSKICETNNATRNSQDEPIA